MTLIIPGVEIRVIKELVPRQLGATGILGIVGQTEIDHSAEPLRRLSSLSEFRSYFGAGTMAAMPEVRQAFANGVREVVCANLPAGQGSAARTTIQVDHLPTDAPAGTAPLTIKARAAGLYGSRIGIRFVRKLGPDDKHLVDVGIFFDDYAHAAEQYRGLSCDQADENDFISVINAQSGLVRIEAGGANGRLSPTNTNPEAPLSMLASSAGEATPANYALALERLEAVSEIDLVTASVNYGGHNEDAFNRSTKVFDAVRSHAERMSAIARNRIGFGQIPAHGKQRPDMTKTQQMASTLTSERFALVAPHGYLGAVVGRTASLGYYESPTFKTLGGVVDLTFDFTDGDLRSLLTAGVMPVDRVPRKGIAIVKGIHTDNSQVSVQRIADRAVRHVQNIAQDFIGLLNTQAQRLALKQLIIGAFTTMANENALVPSTDGSSPPFQVDVESSPSDFSQGIVRVSCAVRPVRAIDYIYATILVQAT